MSVAVYVITDGRDDYLAQCVNSLGMLVGDITEWWMYDDTGDDAYRSRLAERYPQFRHINAGPRQGGAGAIRYTWRYLRDHTEADYLFWVEGDFVFRRPIDLAAMAGLLDERPYLAQVVLKRQPCNSAEEAAGGFIEMRPDTYIDMCDDVGRQWLEHRNFFTTNPCLFRRSLLDIDWPESVPGTYSESTFQRWIFEHGTPEVPGDQIRYAYWGARDSGVWTWHIGQSRSPYGKGY